MVDSAYFVYQILSELTLDLFNILRTCYMHIEDVHEKSDAEKYFLTK